MFLRFLEAVPLVSTSQDRSLEQAIAFLLKHRNAPPSGVCALASEERNDTGRAIRALVDLSFVPATWWPLVTGQKAP